MYLKALVLTVLSTLVAADAYNPIVPLPGQINVGEPTTIIWKPNTSGTISLQLRWGPAGALDAGTSIASALPNTGSYTWTPDASIAPGSTYTIEITDDIDPTETNFSPTFGIVGGNAPASAGYGTESTSSIAPTDSTTTVVINVSHSTALVSSSLGFSVSASAVVNGTTWTTMTTSAAITKSGSAFPQATTNAGIVLGGGAMAAIVGLGAIAAGVL